MAPRLRTIAVDHKILLWKLHNYFGIKGTSLNLFEIYLSNRYSLPIY